MSRCASCGKKIQKKDEFVLEGKYPSGLKIWATSVWNCMHVQEAKQLLEVGFEYITDIGEVKLFRKRK